MKTGRLRAVVVVLGCLMASFASSAEPATKVYPSSEETQPLKVGDSIPHVMVTTLGDKEVDLQDLATRQATVIIFYRGGWCPYCNQHLQDLKQSMDGLEEMGYQVLAISTDIPEQLRDAKNEKEYPYVLLSDSDTKAAAAFGIAFKLDPVTIEKYKGYGIDLSVSDWELPVPSVFVNRADGVITFVHADPDYTKRISSAAVLKAARDSLAMEKRIEEGK